MKELIGEKSHTGEFELEIYRENLKRERTFSIVLFVIAIILLIVATVEVIVAKEDRVAYIFIYGTLALLMTISFFVTRYLAEKPKNIIGSITEVGFVILMNGFGVSLALSDVVLSNQVNAYVGALMITGAIFYFKPQKILLVLIFSHAVFLIMLHNILGTSVMYIGFVVNTTVMMVIAFMLSKAGYSLYLNNFTVKKKLEEKTKELAIEKEKAETANKYKSEFISNMSHEIRTPLNAIIGFSELLKEDVSDEKDQRYLKGIIAGGESLLQIINEILDISKIEAGKMIIRNESADLRRVIYEIKHIFLYNNIKKDVEILFEIGEDLPDNVIIDEVRIRQILLNLIGNSVKFTNTGFIKVKIDSEKDKNGKIKLILIVEDTGIGIPKEHMERVFEPFTQRDGQSTRKYGGTGLGLTITKKLVELMGGILVMESEVDKGTKFTIELYNIDSGAVSACDEHIEYQEEEAFLMRKKIVYAEDVEANRSVMQGYLSKYGIEIIEAANGQEAYEKTKKYKPDLIIMDIHMPIIDGIEALKLIRSEAELSLIPVIALTAQSVKNLTSSEYQGFNECIEKPINKKILIKLLKKYLVKSLKSNETSEELAKEFKLLEINSKQKNEIIELIDKNGDILVLEEIKKLIVNVEKVSEEYNSKLLKMVVLNLKNAYAVNDIDVLEFEMNKLKKYLE